ncbi:MAG: prepilin peptidase [Lachnospiraceae bacterium]|nr:prepilin peptidase [Lachnospiraceae bacterium]
MSIAYEYEKLRWIFLLLVLLPESVSDIKERKIHLFVIIPAVLIAEFLYGLFLSTNGMELIFNLIPGVLLLLLAHFSKESVGYGDGISLLFVGAVLGMSNTFFVLVLAFSGCAILGLIVLLFKLGNKKSRLPFLPFILGASLICELVV